MKVIIKLILCFLILVNTSCEIEMKQSEKIIKEKKTDSLTKIQKAENNSIQEIAENAIRSFDSLDLRSTTGHASISYVVFDILSKDSRIKIIAGNKTFEDSLRENFFSRKQTLTDDDRVKYYSLFGICKDTIMVRELLNYISKVKDEPREKLEDMYHPFYYAVNALELITGIRFKGYSYFNLSSINNYITKVKEWQLKYGRK